MQCVRNSILRHVRVNLLRKSTFEGNTNRSVFRMRGCQLCTSTTSETSSEQIKQRVIELVKKFDRIDSAKVTETADFQKDLSLDSLDRVELVMAFEEEFSIDIPEEKADKLTCCADVARYIAEGVERKAVEKL